MLALAVVLAFGQQPADTAAQAGARPCEVAIDTLPRYRQVGSNYYGGGHVVAHCKGTSTSLVSDSVAYYAATGRFDMVGRVHIRDTALTLDAQRASYFLREERLEAHNQVVAVNRVTGSVLRGPNLNYYRAVVGIRDTVEMYATQRPTVEYRRTPDSGEPYLIVGDRIRFKGDDRVWAAGKVTVDRSDFASRSDSLALDETTGTGVLTGAPRVEGRGSGANDKGYTLVGTRIDLGLEKREVRLVKALGKGKATGDDWTLTADTIHLLVTERKLQRAFAWGDSSRPHAISSLYTLLADSLAIDTPDQVLTESRAYGNALSTARRDSTAPASETDWISGDSLRTRFGQETDSAGHTRSRLQQIHSWGSARALTHHYDEADSTRGPAINYSRGQRIDVALKGARIDTVVVGGKADGVHLERPPAKPAAAADTTKHDDR